MTALPSSDRDRPAATFRLIDGVARLTLTRPDRLNAMNARMHRDIAEAFEAVEASNDVRVLVIRGEGRAFCAGQDLAERKLEPGAPRPDLGASVEQVYNPLIRRLDALTVPTVAAVNGVAAGAGANLALACDFVIATQAARFIQSFVAIGLAPDCGGTWRLPRLVGQARAAGLAMLGEPLAAKDAEAWGLIWRCVADDRFDDEVETLVTKLARAPTLALAGIKRALRSAGRNDLTAQLDLERDLQAGLGRSDDYSEGVNAFKAKRPPEFRGR